MSERIVALNSQKTQSSDQPHNIEPSYWIILILTENDALFEFSLTGLGQRVKIGKILLLTENDTLFEFSLTGPG